MKSKLIPGMVGSLMCFVVALSLLGCVTPDPEVKERIVYRDREVLVPLMPLNDYIITQVGGLVAMQETTLFVSDVITLRLNSIKQEFSAEGERIVRTSDILDTSVRIEPIAHKGNLKSPQEGNILYVDFETTGRNMTIPFVKQGSGGNEKYEIYFTGNVTDRIIDVGAATYIVSYGGNERNETPYLQFMLTDRVRGALSSQ